MPFSGVIVQGLKVIVGCEDQPDQRPVVFAQNSDGNILFSFFDEFGNIVDVSGATALALKFLQLDGQTVLTKTPTQVSGQYNQLIAQLAAADLALLPPGDNDAQILFTIAGVNYAVNLYSALSVESAAV